MHDAFGNFAENPIERHGGLTIEWLGTGFVRFGHSDRVDNDEAGFAGSVGRDGFQRIGINDPAATSFHLFKVGPRVDVSHEDQTLKWLDVRAGGDHVDRDGDPRVVAVAELLQQVFGLVALGGDLLAEVVAFAKLFPHDFHDVVGMQVFLGKDQSLGDFGATWKNFGKQAVAEGLDDQANLVFGDDVTVKFRSRVG